MEKSWLSIIIPTLNEAARITNLVNFLLENGSTYDLEIIVVNSIKSTDNLAELKFPENVKVISSEEACRSKQLQLGAQESKGDVLYFLHADTIPPKSYMKSIFSVLKKYDFGMFAYQFDTEKWFFKFNGWMTQWKGFYSGGGDQGLFLKKETFNTVKGFDISLRIMEDYDLFWRLKKSGFDYTISKSKATVSARKYENNSAFKVNTVNLITLLGFKVTGDAKKWSGFYKRYIKT